MDISHFKIDNNKLGACYDKRRAAVKIGGSRLKDKTWQLCAVDVV